MMSWKTLGAVAGLATAVLMSPVAAEIAAANPIALYYSTDGTNYTAFGSQVAGTGVAQGNYSGAQYTISAQATGSPTLPAPSFTSSNISVSSTGAGVLYVKAEETGLSTPGVTAFNIGFTNNNGSNVNVTEGFSTTVGGVTTMLASATLTPNTATASTVSSGTLSASYTIDEIYRATFGAGGGTEIATISESANVPEPLSLALLGTGVAGIGLAVRGRRKSMS